MIPLPLSTAVIERGIAERLHLGAQLYVSVNGRVVANLAIGESRFGVPMEVDTLLLWLSSGKPLTAVAIAQLWEQNRLTWDQPVSDILPEFGQAGKEAITIRQLLTHTGGIRTTDKCDAGTSWDEILECIYQSAPELRTAPAEPAAYHPSGSWYVLGEIVHKLDGRPIEEYLRAEVFGSIGMRDCWIALPANDFHRYGQRLAVIYHTEKTPPTPHRKWNSETEVALCRPGRNGRGPIRELGRFYEALLAQRREEQPDLGRPFLKADTVRQMTTRQRRERFDDTFQQVIDWGLGFAIDSKRYGREMVSYGFGRYASDQSFGHGGSQSSCGFADPANGVVVAWAFNGLPGERLHQLRAHELNSAIYRDLGLTGS